MAADALVMMPWFPKDFMASTRHMTLLERGAYRELLDYQWEMGALPVEPERLARLLGITAREFAAIWEVIGGKFVSVAGGLVNPRLEQHRSKYLELREKRAASGGRGGLASAQAKVKQSSSKAQATPQQFATAKTNPPTPTPTPTTSLRSVGNPPEAPPHPNGDWGDPPAGCDPQAWAEWAEYKRGKPKRQTLTKHANFMRKLTPEQQQESVDYSIRNQYDGCFAPKENGHATSQHSPRKSAVEQVRDATGCDLRTIVGASPPRLVGTG